MTDLDPRREKIAAAIREFRPSVDLVPVINYIDDLEGTSTSLYVSGQTEAILGVSEQEWLDDPDLWEKLIHPDDLERVMRENDESDRTGFFSSEYRVVTRDGQTRWVRDEAVLVRDYGRPLFWRGSMVDVTDRRRIEQTLRRTEAQFRALVERMPGCVYIEEIHSGRLRYLSPQIEEIAGYPAAALVEKNELWEQIVHPDDLGRYLKLNHAADTTYEPFLLEYRLVRPDGHAVWIRDESHLVVEDGTPLFWQGLVIDVTERRRAERERAELLGRLVAAQEEERARIASSIHDEPIQKMTAVGLRLFTLRADLDGAHAASVDQLEITVKDAIARMRALLFELRPPALERDGLASAIGQYADATAREGDPQIVVENRLLEDPPIAMRTIAYRIVQEAIMNARRHAGASRVNITLEEREGGVVGLIDDDGVGFDPSADSRAGRLGITTMRERAEMAAGWLRIESSPGGGSSIEFWLPGD